MPENAQQQSGNKQSTKHSLVQFRSTKKICTNTFNFDSCFRRKATSKKDGQISRLFKRNRSVYMCVLVHVCKKIFECMYLSNRVLSFSVSYSTFELSKRIIFFFGRSMSCCICLCRERVCNSHTQAFNTTKSQKERSTKTK